MNTRAPELSALIIILGSAGPVISTRRSCRSAGAGATVHADSRMSRVAARKSGRTPASMLGLALLPLPEQLEAGRAEPTLQVRDEGEGIVGQDPVPVRDDGPLQLDAGGQVHASPRRTVASISPCGSVVGM